MGKTSYILNNWPKMSHLMRFLGWSWKKWEFYWCKIFDKFYFWVGGATWCYFDVVYAMYTKKCIWYNMRNAHTLPIVKWFRRLLEQVGPVGVGDSLIEERTSLVQSTSFTLIFYYNKLTSFTMIFFYNKSIASSIIFFILLPSFGAVSPFYNNRSPNQPTIQVYKRPNE